MKGTPAGIPLSTLLLVLFASTLCLLLLAYLGYILWRFWRGLDQLELKDRFAIKNDVIKTAAQILGGAFFLFGLYFTWLNLEATKEKNRADLNIAQEKQTTDLFTRAIEQLGSNRLEVRLGGIYALERIARDSEKDHGPIMEVLTAYVRQHAPAPKPLAAPTAPVKPEEGQEAQAAPPLETKPQSDVQAVLTVIGRRARTFGKGEHQGLDLRGTDLRGADLRNAHLEGALLSIAHLEGADLRGAHLEKAILENAHLENADLLLAHLEGAILRGAHLEEAILSGVYLEYAVLVGAHLEYAFLWGAHLEGAFLGEAHLKGAFLGGAHLKGAHLTYAQGLTREQLAGALNLDENMLPDYLKQPQPEKPESK